MATWVSLGCSPGLPPSCSNSLTSLLPNSYPPWCFPMGIQLIQLSEHTLTICFEVFFSLDHSRNSSAASLGKCNVMQFSHFPDHAFWVWNHPSGETISAFKPRARRWERAPGERRGVNEGRIRKAKWWKGGRSSESPSEDVPGRICALFSLQWCLSLVGPRDRAFAGERNEANVTSPKRSAFSAFVLVGLLLKKEQTQNGEQKGGSADGGTITDILGTLNNLSAQTLKRPLSVTFVYKPPWKGRLTCPYPFIWVQMARGIHCVRRSSLNSLVWPVISRPKVRRFGEMWVCHKKSPADLLGVTNPLWRAFQGFYVNGVKGEVWDISMAEPMDSHQKGI